MDDRSTGVDAHSALLGHAAQILTESLVSWARAEAELPHIVVAHHVAAGRSEHFGPYPAVTHALVAADALEVELAHEFPDGDYRVSVAPLLAGPPTTTARMPSPRSS